jgi:hypothetical protein
MTMSHWAQPFLAGVIVLAATAYLLCRLGRVWRGKSTRGCSHCAGCTPVVTLQQGAPRDVTREDRGCRVTTGDARPL